MWPADGLPLSRRISLPTGQERLPQWQLDATDVIRIVENLHMRGVRILGGFLRHDAS